MVQQLSPLTQIDYPDSDGQPMADNTLQFEWIVTFKENLELLFADNPNVFVAGDLLWYPVEGNNQIRRAPDVLVVFGRPKSQRGSYQQWREESIAPQVVFEILSPGNKLTEMALKLEFYDRYGVEEYYLYNPDRIDLTGWYRQDRTLRVIEDIEHWHSPRLGIYWQLTSQSFEVFKPSGEPFLTFLELDQRYRSEKLRADQEKLRADQEKLRADQERLRAEQAEAELVQLRSLLMRQQRDIATDDQENL
jgi:Uma2 family endonuclease